MLNDILSLTLCFIIRGCYTGSNIDFNQFDELWLWVSDFVLREHVSNVVNKYDEC